ncbi:MAG: Unknown protein [uncultured Aureispira sp.]|uniref:Uncharacterized protein n=1 Tax=uncultured Aureispira sp. TaxID=1331704 RepID=A0A6S6TZA9_9BACT|nr:MAG: Unknown protein [uncultured Aureispira sp.]
MPTNRILFTIKYFCFLMLFNLPILLSAQVSTSLNQSFKTDAAQSISIQVNSPNLKIVYIKGRRVLVETTVSVSIENSTLLHFMTQKGRYDLIQELDENTKCLNIIPKNKQNLILVKGEKLKENISYTIYIPEEMAFIDLANK